MRIQNPISVLTLLVALARPISWPLLFLQVRQDSVSLLGILPRQLKCNLGNSQLDPMLVCEPSSTHCSLFRIVHGFGIHSICCDMELNDQLLAPTKELSQLHARIIGKSVQTRQNDFQAISDKPIGRVRKILTSRLILRENMLRNSIFAFHFFGNESQMGFKFPELSAAVREGDRLLSILLGFRSLVFPNLSHPLRGLGSSSECVSLNTEKEDRYCRHNSNSHCSDARKRGYGIPPHDAVGYAKFLAAKDSIPLTHSMIPLWTGGHSAMPMRPEEIAHG